MALQEGGDKHTLRCSLICNAPCRTDLISSHHQGMGIGSVETCTRSGVTNPVKVLIDAASVIREGDNHRHIAVGAGYLIAVDKTTGDEFRVGGADACLLKEAEIYPGGSVHESNGRCLRCPGPHQQGRDHDG